MTAKDRSAAANFVKEVALAYGSELHRFLVKRLRAGDDADDMAQEVYLRLLRLQRSDLIRQPIAYVYFLASQVAGEHRLRASRRPIALDSETLDRAANLDGYLRKDELPDREHIERELKRLLAKLSAAHRTILVLRKRDGYSIEEIAEHLQMSVFKVRRYLVEANAKLLEKMRQGEAR
jgi:RNA polymerase sigma-70 factor (ECF subfamily)